MPTSTMSAGYTTRTHWLVDVAVHDGLLVGVPLTLDADVSIIDAWEKVAAACGVSEDEIAQRVAARYRLKVADLETAVSAVQSLVPEKIAQRYTILPLRANDRQITVAISDPTDLELEQAIAFSSGRTPTMEIAPPSSILKAMEAQRNPDRDVENLLGRVGSEAIGEVRTLEETRPDSVSSADVEAAPVVKL